MLFAATLAVIATAAVTTNTTDLVQGITTRVDDVYAYAGKPASEAKVPISTSVKKVTYGAPALVERAGIQYWEVTGTIQGIGWGGASDYIDETGNVPFTGLNVAHYDYDVTFVLRWSRNWNGVLDVYNHGAWSYAVLKLLADFAGPAALEDVRHLEREGDALVSDLVLGPQHNHAYFAWNAMLRADGSPALVSREGLYQGRPLESGGDAPIARDVAQVAKRLVAKLAKKPVATTIGMGHSFGATRLKNANLGTAPLMSRSARATLAFSRLEGGPAGAIPAGTAVWSDEGVVFLITSPVAFAEGAIGPRTVVAEALYSGPSNNVSAGTLRNVDGLFDGGITVTNPAAATGGSDVTPRTGDMHERAYDTSSPKIFDGLVLFATGCTDPSVDLWRYNTCAIDPGRKMQVPMTIIAGELQTDAASMSEVRMAALLADAGADVARDLRVYQVRNLPHNWDEVWLGTPNVAAWLDSFGMGTSTDSGRMGPVAVALIENMVAHVRRGTALLPARLDGFVTRQQGVPTGISYLQFDRLRSPLAIDGMTNLVPFVDDPRVDYLESSLQANAAPFAGFLARAQAAMPSLPMPIFLPETTCRDGGLTVPDSNGTAFFNPLDAEIFLDAWGSASAHRLCLTIAAEVLAREGLYDR